MLVHFKPSAAGEKEASLFFITGNSNQPVTPVGVNGTGVAPPDGAVSLEGRPIAGGELTCSPAGFPHGTGFRYQWLRNGREVAGATATRLRLDDNDIGARFACRVGSDKRHRHPNGDLAPVGAGSAAPARHPAPRVRRPLGLPHDQRAKNSQRRRAPSHRLLRTPRHTGGSLHASRQTQPDRLSRRTPHRQRPAREGRTGSPLSNRRRRPHPDRHRRPRDYHHATPTRSLPARAARPRRPQPPRRDRPLCSDRDAVAEHQAPARASHRPHSKPTLGTLNLARAGLPDINLSLTGTRTRYNGITIALTPHRLRVRGLPSNVGVLRLQLRRGVLTGRGGNVHASSRPDGITSIRQRERPQPLTARGCATEAEAQSPWVSRSKDVTLAGRGPRTWRRTETFNPHSLGFATAEADVVRQHGDLERHGAQADQGDVGAAIGDHDLPPAGVAGRSDLVVGIHWGGGRRVERDRSPDAVRALQSRILRCRAEVAPARWRIRPSPGSLARNWRGHQARSAATSLLRRPGGLEGSGRWFNPAARPGPGRAAVECQPPPGTQSCENRWCAAREGAPRRDEREPLPLRRQTRKETRDQTTRGSLRPGCLRRARMAGSSQRQSHEPRHPGSVARGARRDPVFTKMVSDDYWKISVVQSPPWRRTSWARVGPSGRSWKSTKKSGSTSIPPSGEQFTRNSHERSAG